HRQHTACIHPGADACEFHTVHHPLHRIRNHRPRLCTAARDLRIVHEPHPVHRTMGRIPAGGTPCAHPGSDHVCVGIAHHTHRAADRKQPRHAERHGADTETAPAHG